MIFKKPLNLILNHKLWGKLVKTETSNGSYGFVVRKKDSNRYYTSLYSSKGELLINNTFEILDSHEKYLYIFEYENFESAASRCWYKIVDLRRGVVIGSFVTYNNEPIMKKRTNVNFVHNGVIVFELDSWSTILETDGNVIEFNAKGYCIDKNVLVYLKDTGTYVYTANFRGKFDFVERLKNFEESMYFLGKDRNGLLVYQVIGFDGNEPAKQFFTEYRVEKDGLIVKLCDINGNETDELAFVEKDTGKFFTYTCCLNLLGFERDRGFVIVKDETKNEDSLCHPASRVQLVFHDGTVLGEYKAIYSTFDKVHYGIFDRFFAIVLTDDNEFVYIDEDGAEFPMPESEKANLRKCDNIAFANTHFSSPLR